MDTPGSCSHEKATVLLLLQLPDLDAANDGGRGYSGAQKLLGWAGLGLGTRGLGLSCKSSCGAVEECVVRLAKVPGLDED